MLEWLFNFVLQLISSDLACHSILNILCDLIHLVHRWRSTQEETSALDRPANHCRGESASMDPLVIRSECKKGTELSRLGQSPQRDTAVVQYSREGISLTAVDGVFFFFLQCRVMKRGEETVIFDVHGPLCHCMDDCTSTISAVLSE